MVFHSRSVVSFGHLLNGLGGAPGRQVPVPAMLTMVREHFAASVVILAQADSRGQMRLFADGDNQALLGEIIGWRNLFWSLSNAMVNDPVPWVNGSVLPKLEPALCYRTFAGDAYGRVKEIIEKIVASALIYLPSSVQDLNNPEIDRYLKQYVRGSNGIDHVERIKIMKLLWDAIGTEFGARHELYEINYIGSNDVTRLTNLWAAQGSGNLDKFKAFAKSAMDEYDLDGWTVGDLINPDDVSVISKR